MKKVIYSLAFGLLALTSCATWDDPKTEVYGGGPDITINLAAAVPTDSAFVLTLTPGAGTTYYAFAISTSKEDVNASTLLKGGYGNAVVHTNKYPTLNYPVSGAAPNTKYYVYAVASDSLGVVGDLALDSIMTSDQYIPTPVNFAATSDKTGISLTFSEPVSRGTGAVSAKYYKEWDIMNPVDVADSLVNVDVDGQTVVITPAGVPAGAFVCVSYEAGAFVDAVGNKCEALTSALDLTEGKFTNLNYRVPTVTFAITDANVVSPADGTVFPKYTEFKGELKFDFDIYRNDLALKNGDLNVIYKGAGHTASYDLSADQWSVADSTLTFVLPAAPSAGDMVYVNIGAGVFFDVFGNGNEEYTSSLSWKYFAMTKDMVLGTFAFTYQSAYDETPETYEGGVVTITEDAEVENGLIIKNLWVDGSEVAGSYDISKGEFYIGAYQALGVVTNSKGTKYGLVTYSLSGAENIAFAVNPDGTITSADLAIVACDETYENLLGYWEKCSIATFTPQTDAVASKRAVSTASVAKKVYIKGKALKNKRISK